MSTDYSSHVRRMFDEVINNKNLDAIDELVAPSFMNHSMPMPEPGPAGFRQVISAFTTAFPDMRVDIDDVIVDGDRVATRGTMTGTHDGEFNGIPATGRSVNIPYIDVWRFDGDKAVENWVTMDMLGMMQQLGVVPEPSQSR